MRENNARTLLEVENLRVVYNTDEGIVRAVNGISFQVCCGKTLGIVGETGAGKTTTALSILGLLPERVGRLEAGSIRFDGLELVGLSFEQMRAIRGERISMIFQDPMTSLNPVISVGDQIAEVLELHHWEARHRGKIEQRVDEILQMVGIPPARKGEYPHQFSGGMKQRVVIATALACEPGLLIADEPTTALDVTIQAQVLDMIDHLREELSTAMILITHDLGIVAQNCDDVAVMYAGEIVEYGTLADLFAGTDHHPYTTGLFGSIPDLSRKTRRLNPIQGLMPDPMDLPAGCKFHPRCDRCMEICLTALPRERLVGANGSHRIKCHLYNHCPAADERPRPVPSAPDQRRGSDGARR